VPAHVGNATGHAMAFLALTSTAGPKIVAYDLTREKVAWRQDDDVAMRVVVAKPAAVYARRDGSLIARDVASGERLWQKSLPSGGKRMGYAAEGDLVCEVTLPSAGVHDAKLGCYDAASGSNRFHVDLPGDAGAPAIRGGLVAVPRRSQFISLVDGANGDVLAHILSREEAATFVRALPEGLFFGSRGVYLASAETAAGKRDSGGYIQAKLPEFVRAFYYWDMYRPEQEDYSAVDRNRILWRVAADGARARFADDLVVVHNFRFFFGLDAGTGKLRWAYNHPRADAVASERTGRAVVFVAADGGFGAIDLATGQRTWEASLGETGGFTVRGATFDAEGFEPAGKGGRAEPVAKTLANILWDPDRRFVDVKIYAIDELAKLPGRDVTTELLRALEATELPGLVAQKATEALVARHDPETVQLYIRALHTHGDYVEDKRAPRLDVLARAVATTKAREVIPALVAHLRLPDTDPSVVRDIADAALATGAREALEPFQDYLLLYRADAAFLRAPVPLQAAAEVLMKLGGPSERALLLFVAEEPRTIDPLRSYLQRTLYAAGRGR
jgi:outer membrane protein assembly factor BamB